MTIMIQSVAKTDIHLGHQGVDTEHQIQMELLTALEEALTKHDEVVIANDVFGYLVAYTDAHFNSERLLMRLHAYPQYEAHEQEHSYCVEQLQAIQQQLQAGEAAFSIELVNTLRHWLIEHIQTADRAFGIYLAAPAA